MTADDLFNQLRSVCFEKLIRGRHKPDPMSESVWDIITGGAVERAERFVAFNTWERDPSEENRIALEREIADEVNYLLFLFGKIRGTEVLERP